MATSPNSTQITPPRVPITDERTGAMSREWYRWFYSLYNITGAGAGIIPVASGGTGLNAIPTNGQLLIGNGTGYALNTLNTGSGISVTNGAGTISVANTGVLSNIAGSGIAVSNATGNVTISNTGVLSFSGGTTGLTPATASTGNITLAGTLVIANGGTNGSAAPTAGAVAYGTGTAYGFTAAGTAGQVLTSNGAGVPTWTTLSSGGSVTSVSFTGGIISVATPTTTPALTVAGTSGGIPYFSSATTWTTSGVLAANALVVGGGAGATPATVTTGTGVVTALGVNTGTAGAFVVNGGALGTPSSGTVTNLTGTASININGTVGATTPSSGVFTSLSDSGNLTFTGTGNRITGDFSNATLASRVAFQSSTVNGATNVGFIPNGTGTSSRLNLFNTTSTSDYSVGSLLIGTADFRVISDALGTGTQLPMTFYTNNAEQVRIDTTGFVGINTASPGSALDVKGTLRLSGATSGYVGLAPAAAAGSTTYTLPSADGSSGQVLSTNGSGTLSWATRGTGSVTSVGQTFTGGLISVAGSPVTSSGTLALTVAGTSGGIPYFSSATTWATSAALAANALVVGGGAGVAPATVTTGTGVVTALGVNTGTAGAFVVNGGALGTPSSGTLTNATGLPISTGVSGLGTNVATALAVNTGTAGAFVVNGGALGTPSSGTLTSATGLPLTTGVTGTLPVGNGGTGTATAFTTGSVVFAGASGVYSQNNANFFWDNTNTRLGVGTTSPACAVDVTGGIQTSRTTVTSPATTDGNIFSGSYTPSLTNTTNITSSTASTLYYTRIGNVIAVFGRVNITATAVGNTLIGISLPVASALATNGQVAGMGSTVSATVANNTYGRINADATNDRAQFQLNSLQTTDQTYAINFTYVVL